MLGRATGQPETGYPNSQQKTLLASHQGVTLIEDLCGTETSNPHSLAGCQLLLLVQQTAEENSHCWVRHTTQLCSLAKYIFIYISSHFSFSVCSSELFTVCRLSAACAVFKRGREEKYVVSELILFLTYRKIPVVFNLDCGVQELYREEKRMCFEQKCESGVPYCFVAGILDNTSRNDKHII